jgi:DNA replication and repair protein RecF
MHIDQFIIHQFRNIKSLTIEPEPGINVFYGQNGSGKTSILEAIYFLAFGRSFRTHLLPRIVQHECDSFSVFALLNKKSPDEIRLGVERSISGEKKLRLNGELIHSLASVAKAMPLLLLTTESHRYFHDGPKGRRQWLDWGVFHVEHRFYETWQLFSKSLKQRNAALKRGLSNSEVTVWDHEIAHCAALLDQYRQNYIDSLRPLFTEIAATFNLPSLRLKYVRGWSKDKDLRELLLADLSKDRLLGYTKQGPHRADLLVYADQFPVGDFLSQGQQKSAAYALHLSQGMLLKTKLTRSPIYLIDDLPSELDPQKRKLIATVLADLKSQIFITGITREELADLVQLDQVKLFHVEQSA